MTQKLGRGVASTLLRGMLALLVFALGASVVPAHGAAEKNDQNDLCLGCHGDRTMTVKRGGRPVSLFVDAKKFHSSVHASLSCTSCHTDLEGQDLPHGKPKKVNCGTCHFEQGEQYAKSLHGRAVAQGNHNPSRVVRRQSII